MLLDRLSVCLLTHFIFPSACGQSMFQTGMLMELDTVIQLHEVLLKVIGFKSTCSPSMEILNSIYKLWCLGLRPVVTESLFLLCFVFIHSVESQP